MYNKWAKQRNGWIKIHVSADNDRIMASLISGTSEHSHDAYQLNNLISGQEKSVYADKAFYSRRIFNALQNNGTEAIIRLRKTLIALSRGSTFGDKKGELEARRGLVEKYSRI